MEILKPVGLLIILSFLVIPVYAQGASPLTPAETFDTDTCYNCHVEEDDPKLSDPARDWVDSVHAENGVTCDRCHAASVPAGRLAMFDEFGGSYRDDHVDIKYEEYTLKHGPIEVSKEAIDYKAPSSYVVLDSPGEYTLVVRKGLTKQRIMSMCTRCHGLSPLDPENPKDVFPLYRDDVHGQALMVSFGEPDRMETLGIESPDGEDAPGCTDCHDAHKTTRLKDLTKRESVITCAGGELGEECHSSDAVAEKYGFVNAYETFQQTHHGKALSLGKENVPVCSDCHSAHGVLKADDPESTISAKNRAETCGQEDCHATTLNVALGSMHLKDPVSIAGVSVSGLIKLFYSIFIPVVVGFFTLFVVTDFVRSITGRGGE
jgi:hypothetical protein